MEPETSWKLLTYAEVEHEYRIKLGTLYSMVQKRQIPHIRIGPRLVRFQRAELERWLAERAVQPKVG